MEVQEILIQKMGFENAFKNLRMLHKYNKTKGYKMQVWE